MKQMVTLLRPGRPYCGGNIIYWGFLAESNENIAQGGVLSTLLRDKCYEYMLYIFFLLKNLTKNGIRIY